MLVVDAGRRLNLQISKCPSHASPFKACGTGHLVAQDVLVVDAHTSLSACAPQICIHRHCASATQPHRIESNSSVRDIDARVVCSADVSPPTGAVHLLVFKQCARRTRCLKTSRWTAPVGGLTSAERTTRASMSRTLEQVDGSGRWADVSGTHSACV